MEEIKSEDRDQSTTVIAEQYDAYRRQSPKAGQGSWVRPQAIDAKGHDCQNSYLSPGDQLVVYKLHGPSLVALCRLNAILAQLRFHAPFWRLIPQLKADPIVKTVNPLSAHVPSVTAEQHMDTPVSMAHTRLGDFLDTFLELGLRVAI